jgi:uncharacterized protein YggE
MKKIVLTSCACVAALGLELQFNKEFSTLIQPNELKTMITIKSNKATEKEAISSLNQYNKVLKNSDNVTKKEGAISVYPQFEYKEEKSVFKHYSAQLRYELLFENSSEVKEVFDELYKIEKNNDTSISMGSLHWNINEATIKEKTDELQLEAIKWSMQYAKELSKEIGMVCEAKKMSINSNQSRPMLMRSNATMSKSSERLEMPILEKSEQEVSVVANIQMDCQ